MGVQPKVNVVTVGAGWTAGILAHQLTAAGMSVVSLEQGPWRTTDNEFQHQHDELRYQTRRDLMVDLSQETEGNATFPATTERFVYRCP